MHSTNRIYTKGISKQPPPTKLHKLANSLFNPMYTKGKQRRQVSDRDIALAPDHSTGNFAGVQFSEPLEDLAVGLQQGTNGPGQPAEEDPFVQMEAAHSDQLAAMLFDDPSQWEPFQHSEADEEAAHHMGLFEGLG